MKCTCSRPIRKFVYVIGRVARGGVIPSKRDFFTGCSWYCEPGWSRGSCHDVVQTESSFGVIFVTFALSNFFKWLFGWVEIMMMARLSIGLMHRCSDRASLGVLTLGARLVLAGLAQSAATMAHTPIEWSATQITKVILVEVPCHVLDEHVMTMHQHHIQHFCFLRGVALEKQGVLMVQCERADREPLRAKVCLKLFQGVLPGWHAAFHSR